MRKEQRDVRRKEERILKKRKRNLVLLGISVLILGGVLSYKKIKLNEKLVSYETKIMQLEEEKAAEQKRSEEIKEYEKYVKSKKYIEEEARNKLGLVYPDEVVFEPEQ